VVGLGGVLVRLVDRHLDLAGLRDLPRVLGELGRLLDGPAVLDDRLEQRALVVGDAEEGLAEIRLPPAREIGVLGGGGREIDARHRRHALADVLADIQREQGEARGRGAVDVLRRLEVVGVGAEALRPARLKRAEDRVVHDVVRGSSRARHLADRLLGEDGEERRAFQRAEMAGGRATRAVAEADRGLAAREGRPVGLHVQADRFQDVVRRLEHALLVRELRGPGGELALDLDPAAAVAAEGGDLHAVPFRP
jgi:hypothetical protein